MGSSSSQQRLTNQQHLTNHQIYLRDTGYCIQTFNVQGYVPQLTNCAIYSDGTYIDYINGQLRYPNSDMCIGIRESSMVDGTGAVMWKCSDSIKDQKWTLLDDGRIRNDNSQLCLTHDTYNKLKQTDCNKADRFVW